VATIVVEGPQATLTVSRLFRAAANKPLDQFPVNQIVFGDFPTSHGANEDLVVCRRSRQRVEIHCHGGRAAAENIIQSLLASGCRTKDWSDWIDGQEQDRISAAARLALSSARTERTAAILLDQYRGALRAALEESVGFLEAGQATAAAAKLADLMRYANVGLHLVNPWQVVFAGRANVGKSSLINAILGYQRSIVYDQPGTTRDVVTAHTAIDGWPVELADTAGLRADGDALERDGMDLARCRLAIADLVVLVLDASQSSSPDAELIPMAKPAVTVHTKCDLPQVVSAAPPGAILTSAVTGAGIAHLIQVLSTHLVPAAPRPGAAVPFTRDQVDAIARALAAAGENNAASALAALRELKLPD
jgi:tRNA modification GTPase